VIYITYPVAFLRYGEGWDFALCSSRTGHRLTRSEKQEQERKLCFLVSLKFIIFVITFSLGSGWVVNFVVGIL
jgi:hypothetical protein